MKLNFQMPLTNDFSTFIGELVPLFWEIIAFKQNVYKYVDIHVKKWKDLLSRLGILPTIEKTKGFSSFYLNGPPGLLIQMPL